MISVFRNVNCFHPLTFRITTLGFAGCSGLKVFYCEAFTAVKIYPELHKASYSFAEEKSRTMNDKQPFGINGHKCDGFI